MSGNFSQNVALVGNQVLCVPRNIALMDRKVGFQWASAASLPPEGPANRILSDFFHKNMHGRQNF